MYNIKGPSKIVAKTTRRGIPQSIENYKDYGKSKINECENSVCKNVPKPYFQKKLLPNINKQENVSPEQVEVIKFIHDSWLSVHSELEHSSDNNQTIYYYNEECSDTLQDFKPFDLESWWGRRLYAHITAVADTSKQAI
ncbi:uncharacterized protein LOC143204322 [Rhynchophorus ferrugineus]|uniref:Uncharacterized protein n=1 Tax=Rhynchophorus ferrugineus TaxID=354439 RepID=A0A834I197_RHYFE|nr:hypothetical protein GWI33_016664 [Rhynchophorus ferrugineus]